MKIENKNVIITGAASGLGKQLTIQMLAKGAKVAALDINEANLKALKKEVGSKNIKTYVVNMANREEIKEFKTKYLKDFKDVDILINNAGIIQPFVYVEDLDEATIDRVMNVNFFGPLFLVKEFVKDLKDDAKEQYIVNIASMGGFFPFPFQTIYGASKAALKLFSEGLYSELKMYNDKVMIVFPGAINTNITQNSNVKMEKSAEESNYKMLEADVAAAKIIKAIEKNKFKLYLGKDAKMLKRLYKFNSKMAIDMVTKSIVKKLK